jgi:hypothetical protein
VQKSLHRILGSARAALLGAALLSGAALPAAGLWTASASASAAVPTHIRPNIFFNYHQTFTVTGTLDSFGGPVAHQPVIVSTGYQYLDTCFTDSHGVAECVLTYAESVAIRQNAGRYTVSFPGSSGYLPSSANGQAIIHP